MFETWLGLLATARTGPSELPVGVRGQTYEHIFELEGDWTASTITGSVRSTTDSGTALATFTFGTPSYSDGFTAWTYTLSGWGSIPTDGDGDGVEYFPYDFLLDGKRLIGGLFPVSGHITEPA